jgi:hypothetical protein
MNTYSYSVIHKNGWGTWPAGLHAPLDALVFPDLPIGDDCESRAYFVFTADTAPLPVAHAVTVTVLPATLLLLVAGLLTGR